MNDDFGKLVQRLQGPVLVLGASGFVGANLLRRLLEHRSDVVGTASNLPAWRLKGISDAHVRAVDLLVEANLDQLLESVRPRTVFNCISYGGYSFQTDSDLIFKTNFNLTATLLKKLAAQKVAVYIHAGSSSEYGDTAAGPAEDSPLSPNSDYAVSKVACSYLLKFFGRRKQFPCASLRLYSVYGPLEDASRLISTVVREGESGRLPPLVSPNISRDFVYVDDVCDAFVRAAVNLPEANYGDSFNIGTGQKTTIGDVATQARNLFQIQAEPTFSMPDRAWDVPDWYANVSKTADVLGWRAHMTLDDGLKATLDWYRGLPDKERYHQASKQFGRDTKYSVSAVIACYRDAQAVPIMYERLKAMFEKLRIEYEIIFVNDNSPDGTEEIIRAISRNDARVIGISHSRNFGSQAAFRSGMAIASKRACVLLDGDLQDPPELIETFVARWREGFDVVYGRRVKRVAPIWMQFAYKAFYRVFDYFSYLEIPHDAGDFSLLDKRVVQWILQFPERNLFLRGVRAFVGFRQVGVDYVRPERMFGRSTNSVSKNLAWAKKGIFSFSYTPLSILSFAGSCLLPIGTLLMLFQIVSKLLFPKSAPEGITTVLICVLFFGSINMFGIGVLAEYLATIFEEVKHRPHYIRRNIIKDGEIREATGDNQA